MQPRTFLRHCDAFVNDNVFTYVDSSGVGMVLSSVCLFFARYL